MNILETERLLLRPIQVSDARFICDLVQEPAYIDNIRDTGVQTEIQAEQFIKEKFLPTYSQGFGFYLVVDKKTSLSMGICGLIKREGLPEIDLGYAIHSKFHRQGYAFEAAHAVMYFAKEELKLEKLLAITKPTNEISIRLLKKLGMTESGKLRLPPSQEESTLLSIHF
jgi:RimJ/RimL family protein N-acetyltransferase